MIRVLLADAIRTVAAGGELIRPALTARVRDSLDRAHRPLPALDPPDPLTGRERAVLRAFELRYLQ